MVLEMCSFYFLRSADMTRLMNADIVNNDTEYKICNILKLTKRYVSTVWINV